VLGRVGPAIPAEEAVRRSGAPEVLAEEAEAGVVALENAICGAEVEAPAAVESAPSLTQTLPGIGPDTINVSANTAPQFAEKLPAFNYQSYRAAEVLQARIAAWEQSLEANRSVPRDCRLYLRPVPQQVMREDWRLKEER